MLVRNGKVSISCVQVSAGVIHAKQVSTNLQLIRFCSSIFRNSP